MADQEVISTESGDGAGGSTPSQKDAPQNPQGSGEGQEPGQAPAVDGSGSPGASSGGNQERKFSWANQRAMEKSVERLLSKALGPINERLNSLGKPPEPAAPAQPATDDKIDYNDIPGSINRIIENRLKAELQKFTKENLTDLDTKLQGVARTQEARNFLWNQPEIGNDQDKVEEVKAVMRENKLDVVAAYGDPVWAIKRGFELWKKGRVNPNAPPRDTLTTITGGAGGGGKGKASVDELLKLQKIVMSDAPEADKQAAYVRIDELAKAPY